MQFKWMEFFRAESYQRHTFQQHSPMPISLGHRCRGMLFVNSTLTAAQLYSTASYQNHDLTGIKLGVDISGWNFAGQDLTNADLDANYGRAANFANANLTNVNFEPRAAQTGLLGADFTNAIVIGTKLDAATVHGFTAAQLYRNR